MTKLLDWLDRRIGRFAVPNLTLALILGQVVVLLAAMSQQGGGEIYNQIALTRADVLGGEWWRLFTFLLVPPPTNLIFTLFFWYLFFLMGSTLESQWGEFRYNAFLFVGWIATAAATMLTPGGVASNLFLQGSVFLAFARLYPDFQIMLFLIVPIKVKWLALFAWVGYALQLLGGDWSTRAMVIASVLNYLLFFGGEHLRDLKQDARRKSYQVKVKAAGKLRHQCQVCGRNSEDEPQLTFRYCSKCAGGRCYCPEHLQDHEHVS